MAKKNKEEQYKPQKMQQSVYSKAFDVFNIVFMILFCITILIPFWDMIVRSFSRAQDISFMHVNFFPKVWSFEAYAYCFKDSEILNAMLISVARTVLGTAFHIVVTCLAANIDGASPLQVFVRIIMPLSKPVLATVSLWQIVGQWNAWFDNMIYTRSVPELTTLQYLLRRMLDTMQKKDAQNLIDVAGSNMDINPETVKAATTVIVVLPIIMVYPFLQKYFVKGIMVGAVKG